MIWFLTESIKKLHDLNQFYAGHEKSAQGGISDGVVLSERLIETTPFPKNRAIKRMHSCIGVSM